VPAPRWKQALALRLQVAQAQPGLGENCVHCSADQTSDLPFCRQYLWPQHRAAGMVVVKEAFVEAQALVQVVVQVVVVTSPL